MDRQLVLKAIADETRMKILIMILKNNCCASALARRLNLTEATVSQHLKTLRKAGLLTGEKRGYYIRYSVEHAALRDLAGELEALAEIKREACTPEQSGCRSYRQENCFLECNCNDEIGGISQRNIKI